MTPDSIPGAGCFISLDGIDGTGKSTQCRLLVDWLRSLGHGVVACNDPGGTPLGDRLRALLLDLKQNVPIAATAEALLFMASRAQLVDTVIRPALTAGQIVVSDRFTLANVVYQGHAGGLDVESLWTVGALATGGLQPDRTIVLDLPVAAARQRRNRGDDRMESRATDYHERVRQGFLAEAARRPDRVVVLDASPSVEVVQQQIREQVQAVLRQRAVRGGGSA